MTQLELIGAVEAAEILNVSLATTKRLAKAGRLPVVTKMTGATGAYLFLRSDVEAFAQSGGAA